MPAGLGGGNRGRWAANPRSTTLASPSPADGPTTERRPEERGGHAHHPWGAPYDR